MAEFDLSPMTVDDARSGMARITEYGERGATNVTTREVMAMARTIAALLIHIGRLEHEIAAAKPAQGETT